MVNGKQVSYYLGDDKLRYSELEKSMHPVTGRTLSLQLKKLEEDKIITREVIYKKLPLKAYYSLTDLGATLIPIVQSIADWGDYAVSRKQTSNAIKFT